MKTEFISAKDTAKLVRARLKKVFPGVKFSVRTEGGSTYSSLRISWQDGPAGTAVDAVVKGFEGSQFDGSIDLKTSVQHWLDSEGVPHIATNAGTEGSGGVITAERQWMPTPDCKRVSFCIDHIFTYRAKSVRFVERLLAKLARDGMPDNTLYCHAYDDGTASILECKGGNYETMRLWKHKASVLSDRFVVAWG